MRVCAYIMLHYGSEYLDAAIRSIDPCVEKIFIYYSQRPSHSHDTEMECPNNEEELKEIAMKASDKIVWDSRERYGSEGEHRGRIYEHKNDYDLCITVDSDEVWHTPDLQKAIEEASKLPNKRFQISGFIHFWKSFNHICLDGFQPVRILNFRGTDENEGVIHSTIYHFGYAQKDIMMVYKLAIHGHKAEIRKDWLRDKYFYWKEGIEDVHLVSIGLWNPIKYDKSQLPDILQVHPNFNKEVIF